MTLRSYIESEIGDAIDEEAAHEVGDLGWYANIENIRRRGRIVGYRVDMGNSRGFKFAFAPRNAERFDPDKVWEDFVGEVIGEVRRRRRLHLTAKKPGKI